MNDNKAPTDFDSEPDLDLIELCKNGLRWLDIQPSRVVNPQTLAVLPPFEIL